MKADPFGDMGCPRCQVQVNVTNNLLDGFIGAPPGVLLCGNCGAPLYLVVRELTVSEWDGLTNRRKSVVRKAQRAATRFASFSRRAGRKPARR
jgi:hypothetical protein